MVVVVAVVVCCPLVVPWPPTYGATALRSVIISFMVPGALTGMFPLESG
jgi:hypothetical protein